MSPPSHPKQADLGGLLDVLVGAGVDLIVVGGAAAVMHSAPITTQEVDVVPRQTPDNLARLVALLEDLDAFIREPQPRRLRATTSLLAGRGQALLSTRLGPLDILCRLHDGRGYDELLPCTVVMRNGDLATRVLDLPTLIDVKTAAGRPKDLRAVQELLAILKRGGG